MNPHAYIWAALLIVVLALMVVGFLWWEAEMMDRNRKEVLKARLQSEFWFAHCGEEDSIGRRANRDHHAD